MRMYDIIAKKRDGNRLTDEEIEYFVNGVTSGEIPDYETSALLMAMFIRGMDDGETSCLTDAMASSGDVVDLSRFGMLSVDKHSTGGVGDKTSLIISPIVAALGCKVAKMSGRGLGHTGGTVDKLESIPGYKTSVTPEEFIGIADRVGLSLVGQSGNMAPADKKLYALRDVTATVNSIPLITSSIMSKKLAAGSKNIVLDVKVGSGAFMKTVDDGEMLARSMVNIGKRCGRNVTAVLTDMDVPLGHAIGNSLEVIEAVAVLKGEVRGALRDICVILASEMTSLVYGISVSEAESLVLQTLDSGAAFEKMKEWIAASGGDVRYIEDTSLFPVAGFERKVLSPSDGYVVKMDAEKIGIASVILGAGREKKSDAIDHSAGIIISAHSGDMVKKGDVLCTLYTNKEDSIPAAEKLYLEGITIGEEKTDMAPIVYKIIR